MPRKSRIAEDHASIQVEMMIPVRHTGRAKAMERAGAPGAPVPPTLPRIPRVTRLMALAIKFQEMVDRSEVRDYADLARLGHVTRARMSQIMNLLLLAPDIQESLVTWDSAEAATSDIAERHLRAITKHTLWTEQRRAWKELSAA
jgi:hypothetical protein